MKVKQLLSGMSMSSTIDNVIFRINGKDVEQIDKRDLWRENYHGIGERAVNTFVIDGRTVIINYR